jgi:hypothetical protein
MPSLVRIQHPPPAHRASQHGARISTVRGPQADQTDDFRRMPSTSLTHSVRERPASRAGSSCEHACAAFGVPARLVRAAAERWREFSAGVAQLVERQPSKLNVASSSLVSRSVLFLGFGAPTPKPFPLGRSFLGDLGKSFLDERAESSFCFAHLAQLVEHVLGKDEVTSSILVVGSKRMFARGAVAAPGGVRREPRSLP